MLYYVSCTGVRYKIFRYFS